MPIRLEDCDMKYNLSRGFRFLGFGFVGMVAFLFSSPAFGKVLYVNGSTGSDATTYAANDAAHPWATIGRAARGSTVYTAPVSAQAAVAGDIVLVSAGIYWETGYNQFAGAKFEVALNPANSGTSGNLITFRGVGDVYVRLLNGIRGPMIGAAYKNYIVWDHFIIDDYYGGSVQDTGPVVFGATTGSKLLNSTVKGHNGTHYWGYALLQGDNYNGVRLNNAASVLIQNNTIHGIWSELSSPSLSENDAGIMTYDSYENIIENNTIYDVGTGVYIKGEHPGYLQYSNIVRKNLFYAISRYGIQVVNTKSTQESQRNYVTQNIVRDCTSVYAKGIVTGGHATTTNYVTVSNNTVDSCGMNYALRADPMENIVLRNNISTNATDESFNAGDINSKSGWTTNYNMHYGRDKWSYNGIAYTNFTSWKAAISDDAHSSVANPLYVDRSGKNFHLQAGSPARTASDTGGPVGAYITGNEVIGSTSTSPMKAPGFPSIMGISP